VIALEAVARMGSFGRAAAELGYTQSAVSQQIAVLERIVGEKLVERPGGMRNASLTEAGRVLLRHADAIVARLDAARADIAALKVGAAGRLEIGTYQSIGARLLPELIGRFVADWPGIEIELYEPHTDHELYESLERGQVDLAFCSLPLAGGPFEAIELMDDPYILLAPADSDLAKRQTATINETSGLPVIGCAATGTSLQDALRACGYTLDFAFRSDNNATLQGLVASGFGVALIPHMAVTPGDDRVRVVRLEPAVPPRRLAVAWHRDRHRSPAVHAFITAACDVSGELERDLAAVPAAKPPALGAVGGSAPVRRSKRARG
jgi:molybdate transport repressor ModE-like protein